MRRQRCGRVVGLVGLLVLALVVSPEDALGGVGGGLVQLAGAAGCLSGDAATPSGCAAVRAMRNVGRIAVSPDGKNVYVPSRDADAVVAFDRNGATGALTQKSTIAGCYTTDASVVADDGCSLASGTAADLDGPTAVAISPDGANVYAVTASGHITGFNRASDGSLSFNDSHDVSQAGLSGALTAVAVSPDGASVYPVGSVGSGTVMVYRRGTTAGTAHGDLFYHECFGNAGNCPSVNYMSPIADVAVAPDNREVLVAAGEQSNCCAYTVFGFPRFTGGSAFGDLVVPDQATGCVTGNPTVVGPLCGQYRDGMYNPTSLAISGDGTRVYVAGTHSLVTLRRNSMTSALTPVTTGGCLTYAGSGFGGCAVFGPAATPIKDVELSTDEHNIFLAAGSAPAALWSFTRTGPDTFVQKPAPEACIDADASGGCGTLRQGVQVVSLAAAPGGRHVYAAGGNRLFALQVDRPTSCRGVGASTAYNTAVTVRFSCSDPDGDPLSYEIASLPVHGSLGAVRGDQVEYGPLLGTSGRDTFTYRAIAHGVRSSPATVTVDVAGPPPGPPPPPPPPPAQLVRIPTTLRNAWLAFPAYTTVRALAALDLPAGTVVTVSCKAKPRKRCPYARRRFTTPTPRARLDLVKPFRKRKLPVRAVVRIQVSAPGFIGKVFTYTMRRRHLPSSRTRCLLPGATTPSPCG